MKFIALILPALALLAAAAPAPEETIDDPTQDVSHVFERSLTAEVGLEKRGHGCNVVRSDHPDECNFYCVNKTTFKCDNGKVLRPYKGVCTGFRTGVCSCYYNTRC